MLNCGLFWRESTDNVWGNQEQVHVWKADLDLEPDGLRELEKSLSPEECARANRFHFKGDRDRFIAARGSLRAVLGQYLNISPFQVQFSYTADKKPVLASGESLRFNVSHSDALALFAVTWGREIGVDLERLRTDFEPEALAKRFFAAREYAAVRQAPTAERHSTFLTYWTCKESYLKATGTGIRCPLNEFSVSLEDQSFVLVGPNGRGQAIAPFRLKRLEPAPGYLAAMAVEHPILP